MSSSNADELSSCAADRYGLEQLKRLALRKQGLQTGVPVATILASARWAYMHTPDTDSKLRAHYLALIIRSRNTFKRSGTMQLEMEHGGKMFFDLFVAMCNHMVCAAPIITIHQLMLDRMICPPSAHHCVRLSPARQAPYIICKSHTRLSYLGIEEVVQTCHVSLSFYTASCAVCAILQNVRAQAPKGTCILFRSGYEMKVRSFQLGKQSLDIYGLMSYSDCWS